MCIYARHDKALSVRFNITPAIAIKYNYWGDFVMTKMLWRLQLVCMWNVDNILSYGSGGLVWWNGIFFRLIMIELKHQNEIRINEKNLRYLKNDEWWGEQWYSIPLGLNDDIWFDRSYIRNALVYICTEKEKKVSNRFILISWILNYSMYCNWSKCMYVCLILKLHSLQHMSRFFSLNNWKWNRT